MQKYSLNCIKCGTKYESDDIDPYYCSSCAEEKKEIAKRIDNQIKPSRKAKSDIQVYEETRRASGMRFPPAKSLGII